MSVNSEMKTKFRASKEWKTYRAEILAERGSVCECCGNIYKKTSSLQIHHKDQKVENYKDLTDKTKHSVLCTTCHKALHFFHNRTISKKNCTTNQKLIELQKPFFI